MNISLAYDERTYATPSVGPDFLRVKYGSGVSMPKTWPLIEEKIRALFMGKVCPCNVYMWEQGFQTMPRSGSQSAPKKRDYKYGLVYRKGKRFRSKDLEYLSPGIFYSYDWSGVPWFKGLEVIRDEYEREELIEHVDNIHADLKNQRLGIVIEGRWNNSDRAIEATVSLELDEAAFLAETLKLAIAGKLPIKGKKFTSQPT